MVNKFLLLEESVLIYYYRIILIRQRNLSAIKNFYVFMIM